MATVNITVKVEDYDGSNKFKLGYIRQKIVVANAGDTIDFDQSDSSNAGHPLVIALYADGDHNTNGSEYTTGVTKTGTPGQAGAKTTFTVSDADLHGTYYYYCKNHAGMGGMIHYGSDSIPSGQTVPAKYRIIDEGATADDDQDGDITSSIETTAELYDTSLDPPWGVLYDSSLYQVSHTNPWAVINTDTRETAIYRVRYNVTDSGGLSAQSLSKYFHISNTPPTVAESLIGNTFWLVNGLDENGVGYSHANDTGEDVSAWDNDWDGFCICNPAGGVTVAGTRNVFYGADGSYKWTEPNHGRYPPVTISSYGSSWKRSPRHWRGQVTFLDESNYVGWTIDTEEKASGGGMSDGSYTVDDTGISFQLYTYNGQKTFKIKLTNVDQLQDGAIVRCDNFTRVVYNATMKMVSAIKCAEGDVPNTADYMATPTWAGSGDLTWAKAYY